jgi:outer membrane protein
MRLLFAALAVVCAAFPAWAQTAPPAAPVTGRPMTLDEAIGIALEGQPDILARLKDYEAARFRVDQAFAPLLPQLSATYTVARDQLVSTTTAGRSGGLSALGGGPQRTVTTWADTEVARLNLSQLLFDFGKNFASTDSARKAAEVAFEDIELQRQLFTEAVKEAYTNQVYAARLILVNQQALERAQLNLRSARGFYEVGTRPKSDVTRAEVDVANARVDVIRASNAERIARVALNTAMGIAADTPTQVIDNLAYEPVQFDRSQLQTEALQRRPEYRQSKLRTDAAEADLKRRFLDFFPDVTGGAFYGATRHDWNEIWEFNLNLTWQIYDGGNRIARYREGRALVEGARARVKSLELTIQRDVEQSILNVQEAQERIQAAKTAVESAQENFRLAQGRFDAGVGTILELTDAQLALTQAQNLEAQALADYRIGLARLDRAVGRR